MNLSVLPAVATDLYRACIHCGVAKPQYKAPLTGLTLNSVDPLEPYSIKLLAIRIGIKIFLAGS